MAKPFKDFVDRWIGQRCGTGQCVPLARKWIGVLEKGDGFDSIPRVQAASDFWKAAPKKKWLHIRPRSKGSWGSRADAPAKGAIVVFGASPGNQYGHVAIATGRENVSAGTFEVIEQNYGEPLLTTIGWHSYQRVIGWLYPR